jgi:hemolysin type calcium-binding protein
VRLVAICILGAVALAVPSASLADHVSIQASVAAVLKERLPSGSWVVRISWQATCIGAAAGANYTGSLSLRDVATGEMTFLGGVTSASGTIDQIVPPKARPQQLAPVGNIGCFEDGSLNGSASGDVVFGYRGKDRLRGRSGNDCLLGGKGNDTLDGGPGRDRLRGGTGNDLLIGGPGANAYDAGGEREARDGALRARPRRRARRPARSRDRLRARHPYRLTRAAARETLTGAS